MYFLAPFSRKWNLSEGLMVELDCGLLRVTGRASKAVIFTGPQILLVVNRPVNFLFQLLALPL